MKNKKKVVLLALCAVLLVSVSVLSTIAFLKSTDSVTNTFTVGKVAITLDEASVDQYGNVTGTDRVKSNTYKLVPSHTYTKDPIVHFAADSEASYLFVKVENGLAAIETGTKIADQIVANGWQLLDGYTDVYWRYAPAATSGAVDYPVFGSFTVAEQADVKDYASAKIVVTAYAIQADGFADEVTAFEQFK